MFCNWLCLARTPDATASIVIMLARLQRFVTFCLVAFAAAWASLAVAFGHPIAAAGGVLLIVFGYLAFMGLEFVVVAWQHKDDPAPRATARQLVRAWWGEVTTSPRVFCWSQPFRSNAWPDHLPQCVSCRGVVLVHGFVCNRGFWNAWLPRLKACGVPYVAVNLEPVFGGIRDYALAVGAAVSRIKAATGQAPVVVAHSMGGLAVRAWLAMEGGDVHRVITIGSPHHGTWAAQFSLSSNARDMRRQSDLLAFLESKETPETRARFTCFYSHCDNIVFPPSAAKLEGADNRHVEGVAHVQLVDQPVVFDEVLRWVMPDSGPEQGAGFTSVSVGEPSASTQSH